MHRLATVMILLAACDGATAPSGASCPSGISSPYCTPDQEGLTCDELEENGTPAACHCEDGGWTCNDCPTFDPPIGACTSGQACAVWGFENDCACSCDATGTWSCVVDDPDPNVHCSP